MGPEFLIDTNIAIAYFNQTLPPKGVTLLDNVFPQLSVITRIELLGWPQIPATAKNQITAFIADSVVYPLVEPIILQTIALRQSHKIKTPDAIIAATALVHNLTLATRNVTDFKQIPGLLLVNPFEL